MMESGTVLFVLLLLLPVLVFVVAEDQLELKTIDSCLSKLKAPTSRFPTKIVRDYGDYKNKHRPVNGRGNQHFDPPTIKYGVTAEGEYVLNISWTPQQQQLRHNRVKPATCPIPTGSGICVDLCSNDNDCNDTLKCCSNGCGHTCIAPVDVKRSKTKYISKHRLEVKLLDQHFKKVIQTLCVKLKTSWFFVDTDKVLPELHFDCIKLLDRAEETIVSIQIFSISSCRCLTRRRRSKTGQKCDTTCSEEIYVNLDKGHYEPHICAGSPRPSLSAKLVRSPDGEATIRIDTGPVPPFTTLVEVMVANGSLADATRQFQVFDDFQKSQFPGNISTDVSVSTPGDYVIAVHYYCKNGDPPSFPLQLEKPVTLESITPPPTRQPDSVVVVVVVVTGICIIGLVTFVVFWRCRAASRQEQHHFEDVTDLWVPEIRNGPIHCAHALEPERRKSTVMALYHPDNDNHQAAFQSLESLLLSFGINIKHSDFDNWRDFADSAGDAFTDILIVLSKDLYKTLHEYINKSSESSEEYERLIGIRGHDIASNALEALRIKSRKVSSGCNFVVHLVSFGYTSDDGERLEELFLRENELYLNKSNTLLYDVAQYRGEDGGTALLNKDHLGYLVKYLSYGEHQHSEGQFSSMYDLDEFNDIISAALEQSRRPGDSDLMEESDRLLNNHSQHQIQHPFEGVNEDSYFIGDDGLK